MYTLTHQQKQFTFLYTRTLNSQGIPDPSLDPNNLCHHYDALVFKDPSDDEDSTGGFLQMKNIGEQLQPCWHPQHPKQWYTDIF